MTICVKRLVVTQRFSDISVYHMNISSDIGYTPLVCREYGVKKTGKGEGRI